MQRSLWSPAHHEGRCCTVGSRGGGRSSSGSMRTARRRTATTREAAMAAFPKKLATGVAMAKTTPPLTAQERVILFCTATGVSHAAVGITAHAMQSMAIKGFIVHDRESAAYALTD